MISIAIDGYSGSGKGELCKGLSEKFGLKHLDTGAILRAIGLYFYKKGIEQITGDILKNNIDNIDINIEFEAGTQKTFLNNQDVSSEIRQEIIGQMASRVAPFVEAMQKMIDISQNFAKKYDCVLDGRNITSAVLPDADVKFFLTADVEIRAKRRFDESIKKGQNVSYNEILDSLKERDWRDTHRDFTPMIQTDDSIYVDNSDMSISETVMFCTQKASEILRQKGKI